MNRGNATAKRMCMIEMFFFLTRPTCFWTFLINFNWLYCNDSFYQRGGGREVDHNRMNQSIHSTHSRFSPEGEPDRTVTIVEGHRVFQNEQLVRQSSILIWVHSPRQSRRLRHKNKSFSDEEWSQKCVIERRYFDSS